jgi:hypothetical protein
MSDPRKRHNPADREPDPEPDRTPGRTGPEAPNGEDEIDTGEIDSEGVVIDPGASEAEATRAFSRDEAEGAAGKSRRTPADEGPTTVHGRHEAIEDLGKTLLDPAPSGSPASDSEHPTTVHERTGPIADAAPHTPDEAPTTTHGRARAVDELARTQIADERPAPPVEPEKPAYEPLAGEVDENAPEQPYSLRPIDGAEGWAAVGAAASTGRLAATRKWPWLVGGLILGLGAFASFFFSPASGGSATFALAPPPEADALTLPRLSGATIWVHRGRWFIGVEPATESEAARLHWFDALSDPPGYGGSMPLPAPAPASEAVAPIGVLEIDGRAFAWTTATDIHWAPAGEAAGGEAARDPIPAGSVRFAVDLKPLYPPVSVEDWDRPGAERILQAFRRDDTDLLVAVDPVTRNAPAFELQDRLLAPPLAFFDDRARKALALIVTTRGATLFDLSGERLAPVRGGAVARFGSAWSDRRSASIARARFTGGAVGWIVARTGAYASIALHGAADGARLEMLGGAEWRPAVNAPDDAPAIVTFPSPDDPARDDAAIVQGDRAGYWIAPPSGAPATNPDFAGPGSTLGAEDFNGDGYWDLVGVNSEGELWMLDGARREPVRLDDGSSTQHRPDSPVAYTRRPAGIDLFHFSAGGDPIRRRLPGPSGRDPKLIESLSRIDRWRAGSASIFDLSPR